MFYLQGINAMGIYKFETFDRRNISKPIVKKN